MTCTAGIVGAGGFAGIELTRILLSHPYFDLKVVTSNDLAGIPVSQEYPGFTGACNLEFSTHDNPLLTTCDVVFLAVPHTAALSAVPSLIEAGVTVIDLSADFRLKNPQLYEAWYKTPHTQIDLLEQAGFGLPELFPDELDKVLENRRSNKPALVGCAGCYPTATSLAAAPAVRGGYVQDGTPVVVNAISGVTGAGKKASAKTHFCFADENVEAYGVATHRHTPEIEQILSIEGRLVFTPHLAPLNRGLLSTVVLSLTSDAPQSAVEFIEIYRQFYADSAFVRVLDEGVMPKTSSVRGTNCAHIGLAVNKAAGTLIAVCAIDNLAKGAAAQAVQCANRVFERPEIEGLDTISIPV